MRTDTLAESGRQGPVLGLQIGQCTGHVLGRKANLAAGRLIRAEPVGLQHQHVDLVFGGKPAKQRPSRRRPPFVRESTAPAFSSIRQLPASSDFSVLELLNGQAHGLGQVSNQSGVPTATNCVSLSQWTGRSG